VEAKIINFFETHSLPRHKHPTQSRQNQIPLPSLRTLYGWAFILLWDQDVHIKEKS